MDKNITMLDDAGALTGAEVSYLVQGGEDKKISKAVEKAYFQSGLTKSSVGLGNVDNTSDANKPVSTAQQAAINSAIATEVTARNAAISTAIASEVTARDAAIASAISTEVTNRNNAIATAIASEVTARDTAIAAAIANKYASTGNAFGGASILGLTDNFDLTIQTGSASMLFKIGGTVYARFLSNGKFLVNRTTALGTEIVGIQGSDTSTTIGVQFSNSTNTPTFSFRNNALLSIGSEGIAISSASGGATSTSGRGLLIGGAIGGQASDGLTVSTGSMQATNYTYASLHLINNFNPTGATTPPNYNAIRITTTFNQQSGSNGYTACLDYNPIVTSVLGPEWGLIVRRPQAKSAFGLGPSGTGTGTPTAPTARIDIIGATVDADKDFAPLRLRGGVDVTTPNEGDIWHVTTNNRLRFYGTAKYDVPLSDLTTGAAAAAAGTIRIRLNGVDYNLLHT